MKNKKKMISTILIIVICIVIVILVILGIKKLLGNNIKLSLGEFNITSTIDTTKNLEALADTTVVPKSTSATVPIFMYHFILDDYGDYPDTENFLKPETLEEQLQYITENGYETIFIDEMDDLYKYKKPVALTFDDCFVYFYDNAFPLLK